MIIEKTRKTENALSFNQVTHSEKYWWCGYEGGEIVLQSPEDEPAPANSKTESLLSLFAAPTHAELLAEIKKRGLT